MFGLGKKKTAKDDQGLYAPLDGEVVALETVADPVFSKKIMGDGYAVEPTSSQIVAPVAAKVSLVQGHALGFIRNDGLEVLLHVGIDTVSLNGAPFKFSVKVGDIVEAGEEVGLVDWGQVEAAGLQKTTMVIFTNTADKLADFEVAYGQAKAGSKLGQAKTK